MFVSVLKNCSQVDAHYMKLGMIALYMHNYASDVFLF